MDNNGYLFLISGPTAAGKTTVTAQLCKTNQNYQRVVTCTTRKPGKDEVNGRDYHFLSRKQFEEGLERNKFLEHALVHGKDYYGTPKSGVEKIWGAGQTPVLVVDVQGKDSIINKLSRVYSIFINPPDFKTMEKRLKERGRDSPQAIQRRLENSVIEIMKGESYDLTIVNYEIDRTVELIDTYIKDCLAQR